MWVDLMCGDCEFEVDVRLWNVGVRDFVSGRESRRVELRDWAREVSGLQVRHVNVNRRQAFEELAIDSQSKYTGSQSEYSSALTPAQDT